MIWEAAKVLACAVALIWAVGSIAIACFRPWRYMEPGEAWLAWAFISCWLPACLYILVELAWEWRLDLRDARSKRARHVR